MTSTRKKWALGIVAFAALLGAIALVTQESEPRFQGRPLSAWMTDLHDEKPEKRAAALLAIQQMGPDAVPSLTNSLGMSQSMVARLQKNKVVPQPLVKFVGNIVRWRSPMLESEKAAIALQYIGPGAVVAIPHLINALSEPRLAESAALALARIGPPAIPALRIQLTSNTNVDAALLALLRMGTNSLPAAPDVAPFLSASNFVTSERAFLSLIAMGPEVASTVTNLFTASNTLTRARAVDVLRQIGPRASFAAPSVLALAKDPDPRVRNAALITLSLLVPERDPAAKIWLEAFNDSHPPNVAFALQMLTTYPYNIHTHSNEIAKLAERPEPNIRQMASNALTQFRSWPPMTKP